MHVVANRVAGAVLLTLLPLGASAQSMAAIEACTKLSDDTARLACFDREVAAHVAREHSVTAAPAPATKLTEEQKLGLTPGRIQQLERPAGAPPPLQELEAKIESLYVDANGHQVIRLENGQVWRQVETHAFDVRPGATVTISRGVSGSYFMLFGTHRSARVSRVK
jgi:hypothetical protein